MKSLHDYIIQEKLKLNKDISFNGPSITINFPRWDDDHIEDDSVWKQLTIPEKEWMISIDYYRSNFVHFFWTPDWILSVCMLQDDFEDFDPKKDILFASDDFQEAFDWYINYLGINNIKKLEEYNDIIDEVNDARNKNKKIKIADSDEFFANIQLKEWDERDFKSPWSKFSWSKFEKNQEYWFEQIM